MSLLNRKTGAVHLLSEDDQHTVCGFQLGRFVASDAPVTCRACKGGYNQTRPVWQDTKHHFVAMGLSEEELEEIAREIRPRDCRTEIEITPSISIFVP